MTARRESRERVIADAAIEVLAAKGTRGLTHRAVDQRARLPEGTTSYYFRTRQSLLEAASRRMLAQFIEESTAPRRQRRPPAEVVDVVEALLLRGEGRSRSQLIARFELGLEATRNPAVAAVLADVRVRSVEVTGALLREADPTLGDEAVDWLNSMILGVLFERLTLGAPQAPVRELARALVMTLDDDPGPEGPTSPSG